MSLSSVSCIASSKTCTGLLVISRVCSPPSTGTSRCCTPGRG
jgi:hypothetical protein